MKLILLLVACCGTALQTTSACADVAEVTGPSARLTDSGTSSTTASADSTSTRARRWSIRSRSRSRKVPIPRRRAIRFAMSRTSCSRQNSICGLLFVRRGMRPRTTARASASRSVSTDRRSLPKAVTRVVPQGPARRTPLGIAAELTRIEAASPTLTSHKG